MCRISCPGVKRYTKSGRVVCEPKYIQISAIIVTVVVPVILGLATLGTGLGLSFGMRKFENLHLAFKILIPIAIAVVITMFASSQLAIFYMFISIRFCALC